MFVSDRRILRSLSHFVLSGTQTLAVTKHEPPTLFRTEKKPPHYVLSRMEDLRTLTLTRCNNLPFILALNQDQNPPKRVLCPKVEELILYVEELASFNIKELMSMAKERALAGEKLSSITIIGLGELMPGKEVYKLKEYVAHVDYRVGEKPPQWDSSSGDGGVFPSFSGRPTIYYPTF